MNYKVFSLLLLFKSFTFICFPKFVPTYTVHLKGNIDFPAHISSCPPFKVYYNGESTESDRQGFFSIAFESIHKNPPLPSLLLCKKSSILLDQGNTFKKIIPSKDKNYKFFEPRSNGQWEESSNMNNYDPANMVIILIDPKIVDSLQSWQVAIDKTLQVPFIQLPRIIIKKNITSEMLEKYSHKSELYSLKTDKAHKKQTPLVSTEVTSFGTIVERKLPQN